MAASTQALLEFRHTRSSSKAAGITCANSGSKDSKFSLIGAKVLFALGAYGYVVWCVLH